MAWGTHFQNSLPEKLHWAATQLWKCQHPQGSVECRHRPLLLTPRHMAWASSDIGRNPWLQTVKPPRDQETWTGRVLSTGICALNKATSLQAASFLCQHKYHLPTGAFLTFYRQNRMPDMEPVQERDGSASLQSWVFQGEDLLQTGQVAPIKERANYGAKVLVLVRLHP